MFIGGAGFGGFFWIYGFLSSTRWAVDLFGGGGFFIYIYLHKHAIGLIGVSS